MCSCNAESLIDFKTLSVTVVNHCFLDAYLPLTVVQGDVIVNV